MSKFDGVKVSKEVKAGIVLIVSFLAFWWIFQFFKGKNLLSSTYSYYVLYDDVNGLEKSKPVSINGLRVGRVEDIEPNLYDDGKILFRVKLSIQKEYKFSKNSIAEIYEPGFISGKEIKLNLVYDGKFAKHGDTLKGIINPSITKVMMEEISPLKNQIVKVLARMDTVLLSTQKLLGNENQREFAGLLKNTNSTVSKFQTTANNINQLIDANQKKIAELMESANVAFHKYGKFADQLNDLKLKKTVENLESTLAELNDILDKMNKGQGTLGKIATDEKLYNRLNNTLRSLEILLSDFQQNPKRFVHFSIFGKKDKRKPVVIVRDSL